jgi:hypothetical protein
VKSARTDSLAAPPTEQLTAQASYPQAVGDHATNSQDQA